jgi:beta-lactam-binding protein with PASTA domain/tRNA A-37 threonylcarbamoyl transferase component Bud32
LLGKILGGRYEILEKIGIGGMSVVYKAKCHLLNRFVAVKVLRPELVDNEEFVVRFKRESQAAASLAHPNIVNMYDVGQEDDTHYIVMEYIDGKTLKEFIREKGRLTSEEAVKICSQICSALNHAHNNHIVHRDIKPQNILMTKDGIPKVADFGIARAVTSATVTMAGSNVIGSVHYFSPEQARGGYVDKKSDIYSLGIVFYEMVTGVVPFEGDSAISVALKHIQEKVTPPGDIYPDIPKSIQYIIEKAIEKDIDKRYHDTADMLSDLNRALKEPDGEYIKRSEEDQQATRVIPAINDRVINPEGQLNEADGEDLPEEYEEEDEEVAEKKRNRIWIGVSISVIILVFLVLFLVLRGIYQQNFARREVEVPLVEGYDYEIAETILKSRELIMKIVEWREDNTVREGEVLSQNPKEGMKVNTDSAVNVIVSSGPKKAIVPSLINESLRSAEIKLENEGLTAAAPEYVPSQIASGYVVEQDPPAYTEVSEGTEVKLYVSKGPEDNMTKADKYTGWPLDIALEMIAADNLEKGTIYKEYNSQVKLGYVYKQSPEPGMNVEKGRKIDLWVSLGEKESGKSMLTINLGDAEEEVRVQVIRTSDDKIVHDEIHDPSKGEVDIILEGTGVESFAIWLNDEYWMTKTLNFTAKGSDGQ